MSESIKNKVKKNNDTKEIRKKWTDLTADEMAKLTIKSACMYGRKGSSHIN